MNSFTENKEIDFFDINIQLGRLIYDSYPGFITSKIGHQENNNLFFEIEGPLNIIWIENTTICKMYLSEINSQKIEFISDKILVQLFKKYSFFKKKNIKANLVKNILNVRYSANNHVKNKRFGKYLLHLSHIEFNKNTEDISIVIILV